MRNQIINYLKKVVPKNTEISITVPENGEFGHYSTNAAFSIAKKLGKPPIDVAREIAEKIETVAPAGFLKKIDVASPGFVNFWLEEEVFQNELREILKEKNRYGRGPKKKDKIQVEFISANPTGPLTLANGRGGFLGDVLANVLEWNGFRVEREYYVNDTGNQIIILGKSAAAAVDLIPPEENFYKGDYMKRWARQNITFIKKNKDNYLKIGRKAAAEFLKDIKNVLSKKAGIKFNRWTSESKDIHKRGLTKKVLEIFRKKGLVYEKEGATWLKTTLFGDDKDRVVVTSDGFPTYFLADAGHYLETRLRGFSRKINILGPDHYGYVARIQAVAKIVGLTESTIIITQFVRMLAGGEKIKMSKRRGTFITFDELINEVPPDVVRFFFLMIAPETHLDFDLGLAKEKSQKNPVYYVQYAYVRATSILKRANSKLEIRNSKLDLLNTEPDLNLMRKLAEFPEIIEDIALDCSVQRLTRYAQELARLFHDFYEKERVIGERTDLAKARLTLVSGTKQVFENLFKCLGISAPDKM